MGTVVKQRKSIYNSWRNIAVGSMVIVLFLLVCSIIYVQSLKEAYQDNMNHLSALDSFYEQLDALNSDVYAYTLTGDETMYAQIWQEIVEERERLSELTALYEGTSLYRGFRDLEEMFASYAECTGKIYDHAYLCNVMTVASKRVINQYYQSAVDIYEAISSEFEPMYSAVLVSVRASQTRMNRRTDLLIADFILVAVISAIMLVIQVLRLFRNIVNPLQTLTQSVGAVGVATAGSGGDAFPEIRSTSDMNEEIRALMDVYNAMTRRIASQVEEIRENASAREELKNQELENLRISHLLKTSELQALQMQINPHYLFNTLNMISQTAYLEGADETKELLDKTAGLFRYTLAFSGKTVTLAKELEILGSYVELQEQRFGGRITFDFDLDERWHQVKMPAMMLQPLVENAIIHGVGMKLDGAFIHIRTSLAQQEHIGTIEISDNGEGMTQQQLSETIEKMKSRTQPTQSIGLGNVYQRLKIFFGERADMRVESKKGEGTSIIMTIILDGSIEETAPGGDIPVASN